MKKTLVFGASLKPNHYSNMAIRRLAEKGIETVGYGLVGGTVNGVQVTSNLEEIKSAHTLSLYMNPGRQQPFYEFFLRLHPKRVIFNPGTENPDLRARLESSGIETLEACTLVMLATDTY